MKRALESNDDLGSRGLSFPPFPSRNNFAHSFYLALTRLCAIYHLLRYVHFPVFTLHAMPLSMIDRGKGVPSFDEMMDIALVEVDFDDPTTNVR